MRQIKKYASIEGLSPQFIRELGQVHLEDITVIEGDPKHWYFGQYCKYLKHVGDKYFTKTICRTSITFKNNKFYGNKLESLDTVDLQIIFNYFKIDWIHHFINACGLYYLCKKPILRQVISGKIKNETELWIAVGKACFKYAYDPALIVRTVQMGEYDILTKLPTAFTNPNEALAYFLDHRPARNIRRIINSANRLGIKIEFNRDTLTIDEASLSEQLAGRDLSQKALFPREVCPGIYILNTEYDYRDNQVRLPSVLAGQCFDLLVNGEILPFSIRGTGALRYETINGKEILDKHENDIRKFIYKYLRAPEITKIEDIDYTPMPKIKLPSFEGLDIVELL